MRRAVVAASWAILPFFSLYPCDAAFAHNLDANAVYTFFDSDTRALLDSRIGGGWTPGTPLIQNGDEIGLVIKAVPDNGTNTGVGGYVTFYLPDGVQLLDAAYIQPGDNSADGITGYDKVPMKGQALMPNVGAGGGPTVSLVGITRGPNIAGVTASLVNSFNVNNGTLPAVYGDLGIFYSTAPETAYGTYSGGSLRNNSGDTVGLRTHLGVPLNRWDTWQLAGYGIAGTTNPAYPSAPLLDSNGRGNTGWGLANAVAGPQSGYAWEFDLPAYAACDPVPYAPTTGCLNAATSGVGPWNRIRYPGSQIAHDTPGDLTAGYFNGGLDASNIGYDLSSAPLPATTGQSNGTPNAVRWAIGQLTLNTPEFVWLKIRVNDYAEILDPSGCPNFYLDTFGGDAGGDDNGKDHIWRYYDPNSVLWNGCLAVGKPATREAVRVGDTFQYEVAVYNTGTTPLTNVVVTDTLPSGVTFLSAAPAQSSGPNPLVWNIGSLQPGQSFSSVVTVKSSATGVLLNTVTVTGNPPTGPPITSTAEERTPSGFQIPILSQNKTVSPTSVVAPGSVQYTIRIRNIGSAASGNPIRITENLPSGFTYLSLASAVVNGATVTGLVTVNNSDPTTPVFTVPAAIQPEKELVLTFNAAVAAGTPSGTYCNSYVSNQSGTNISTGSLACVNVGGGSIGDRVFRDWDNDGVQDADEEGLAGVTLSLYGGACPPSGPTLASSTTDATGFYQFTGLGAGSYCVDAPAAGSGGLPSGYTLTTANDPTTVTLATNQVRTNVDFGYRPGGTGVIGDTVFDDRNADGVFNGSDAGIPSVTVRLYEDTNGNGAIDSGDALVATTSSNGSGAYSFTGLATGVRYIADVDQSDPDVASYFVANYGSASGVTLTTSDPHSVGVLAGTYTSADFGFYKVVPGSIGDDVFLDFDGDGIRDPGEDAATNVTVNLYEDTNGNGAIDPGEPLLETTSTDANGKYTFTDLPAGNYVVDIDGTDPDIPVEYAPKVDTIAVALAAAQVRTNIDFPLVALLRKTVDKTYDDPTLLPNTLTYTIAPRYPGGSALSSVTVADPVPAGTTFVSNPPTSPNASGVASDESEPVDGTIDLVTWDLGTNSAPVNGFVGGTPPPACQTTATIAAVSDTWIDGATVATNHGTDTVIDTANAATDKVGLLRFNISSSTVPAGATINAVSLSLTPDAGAGANRQVSIHNLLTTFAEGTAANAACTTAGNGAAWQGPNCTDDWLSAGGNFGTSDYAATSLTTFNPTTNDTTITQSSAALTAVVSGWLAGGTNRGLAMVPVGTVTNTVSWYPRSAATTAFRPTISITYTPNGCTGTTTIRDTGANEVPDSYIQEDSGGNDNFGTATTLRTRFEATRNKHALVRYNVAAVPAGVTINSATMQMTVTGRQTTAVASVHRMLTPWVEGTSATNGVQWNDPNGTGTAGTWASGIFSSSDYAATSYGTISGASTGAKSLAVTSLVQGWYDGTFTNNGLILLATARDADVQWASSENGTVANRPTLTVNWSLTPSGATGISSMSAAWTVAQAGDSFPVTMRLTNTTASALSGVTPSAPLISSTAGSTASCTAPSPASASVPASGFAEFVWQCTVTAAASVPDVLTFSASATNGSSTWSAATSNGVIVSPVLQFQVNVNNPAGVNVVDNTASLFDGATLLSASNTVHTALTASIGDFVWADSDADGVQDAGEAGMPGVRVFLDADADGIYDVGESFTTTDSSGHYVFTGVGNGTYSVVLDQTTLPSGWYSTTTAVLSRTISVSGQQVTNADFGVTTASAPAEGSIGDSVWIDADADGVFDANEAPLPGVAVTLWRDANGNGLLDGGDFVVGTRTTDASGSYLFDDLYPTNYLVTVATDSSVTTDFGVTTTIGAAMDLVSGVNPRPVALSPGQDYASADFGFNWSGSIGDFAWYDKDGDGIQDGPAVGCVDTNPTQECPAAGMTAVLFYDIAGNGEVDPEDPILAVAVTNVAGFYQFPNLPPGNYVVQSSEQEVPAPQSSANAGQIGTMVHSNGGTIAVPLAAGQDFTGADFGFIEAAALEGHLFHDADRNGILDPSETPLGGITVYLNGVDSDGNPVSRTTVTDADGEYSFVVPSGTYTISYDPSAPPIPANLSDPTTPITIQVSPAAGQEVENLDFGLDHTGRIGDFVWIDADADGIQDAGESGLAGVTVILWLDPNGDGNLADATPVGVQATDSLGGYLFPGLADNTGAARYVVQVLASTLPPGFVQTGDPDEAGTCVVCNSQSPVLLSGGAAVLSRDFGYRSPVSRSVAGTVFSDTGAGGGTALNGIQDGAEAGVGAGVVVTAQVDTDNNGVVDFAITTTSDASGNYQFLGIPSGSRVVVSVEESTLPNASYVRTNDVDGGSDATITIAALTTNVVDRDFGYVSTPGTISGTVCIGGGDGQCNDPGETPGPAGVPVTLVHAGADGILGTADDTTVTIVTGAGGSYAFTETTIGAGNCSPLPCSLDNGLPPGLYQIVRGSLSGYTGLADADGGNPGVITLVLGLNEDRTAQDFEMGGAGNADLRIDKTGPASVVPGTTVVYTITVTNDGPDDAADVSLADATPSGLTFVSNTGDCTSAFPCSLGTVASGATRTITSTYSVPGGYTTPNPVVNSASVSTASTDPNPANNTDSHSASLAAQADFAVSKDDGTAVYVAGGSLTYTITVSNLGPSSATGATVTDVFPPQLTNASWTCSGIDGGTCTASGSGDISDTVNLPVGASVTYLASVDVIAGTTADPLTNSASVAAPPGTTDPTPGNNSDSDGDTPAAAPSAIGDRLWLDEDGDGVQDAGEDGLAGVTVELYDSTGTILIASTTTDTDGRYIFGSIAAGSYVVRVDPATLPAGLAPNPTYDLDDGTTNPDAATAISVAAGVFDDTGDFGFNWVAPAVSGNPAPGATGAIGDRIWNDADMDGIQDFGEAGIPGVSVLLLSDDNGDGVYGGSGDNAPLEATTDASGHYIFDGVAPGSYVIEVLAATLPGGYSTTPTGDPDGDGDSTSNPIVLAPGDVYVSGDFGYPLPGGFDIGSSIFVDADADGVADPGEPGIAGVTISLLDSNGDVIASTVSDANGNYLFPGLPNGTYTVVVTDTANVLADVSTNTADPDGGFDRLGTVTLAGSDNLVQDFGFAPAGHDPGDGLIGDTIFLDRDTDGIADAGEGMQGVTVDLFDSTGTVLIASVVTDGNGQYVFGGLDPAETYVVRVDHATLPNGGAGFANSVDPDGGLDEEASVDLSAFTGGATFDQDFAYEAGTPNAIGGTVFVDRDGDGTNDDAAGGYPAITVILRDQNGNIVGTTTTDASGNYRFEQLPDGTYTIEVSEAGNVLGGLTKSDGPAPGADNNSQVAGYAVTVTGGVTDTTGDFGYFRPGAAFGNLVFEDLDNDGIQDPAEPGLAGVEVALTITYPNGDVTTVVAISDANGFYQFTGLLLDEDFDGVGAGEPTYEVTVATPFGYQASPIGQGGDPQLDSNDPAGDPVTPVQGVTDTTNDALATSGYDFGFVPATDVSIVKTGPGGVTPGFNLVYTTIVTNNGQNDALDVEVDDPTPVGLTFVSNSSSPGGLCTTAYPCQLGTLAAGVSVTITSTYFVPLGYAGPDPIVNVASVNTASLDTNAANDTDDAQTAITLAQADLEVVKTGPASVVPGDDVTYTIDVTNNGPDVADNVILTDPTPGGISFVSASAPCGSGFPCNTGSLAAAATVSITATYSVPASYTSPDPIDNVAVVSSDANDPVPANNADDAAVAVTRSADVSVTKDGPATVAPGSNVIYTVTVSNAGPSDAAGVVVTDATPPGLTFVSNTGGCMGNYPCALGTLAPGSSVVLTSTYFVPASYTSPNPIVNSVDVSSTTPDPDPADNADDAVTTLILADLSIVKSGPASVSPGNTVVFTTVVTNAGPSEATNVLVSDPTPTGLSFVSNAGDCVGPFPCSIGSIPGGQTRSITSTFTVPASYTSPDPIDNVASVSGSESDPNPGNNTDNHLVALDSQADLSIDKTGPASAVPGGNVVYTIVVTNSGTGDAQNVSVTDATPSGLGFVNNAGACSTPYPCALGTVAAGQTRTITSTFSVPPGYTSPDPIVNTATVSSSTPDPDPSDNSDAASTALQATADLSIAKSGPPSISDGSDIVYTIVVTNSGTSDAQNVSVADPTPGGLTFVSNAGACGTAFPCALGTVAVGETRTITSTFSVPPGYASPNPIVNTATVSSTTADPDPSDNSDDASTALATSADVSVVKSDSGSGTVRGGTFTYTVLVTNNGPSPATSVVVSDSLDTDTTYVSDTGGCSQPLAGLLSCPVGNLAVGSSASFTITVSVDGTAPINGVRENGSCIGSEDLCNTVSVSSAESDPVPSNNTDSEPTNVVGADLAIVKTDSGLGVNRLEDFAYTVEVTNLGAIVATGIIVEDTLDPETVYVADDAGCTQTQANILACPVADLAPGETATFHVIVRALATAPANGRREAGDCNGNEDLCNRVTVSSDGGDANPLNNEDDEPTDVTARSETADLSILKAGPLSPVQAGSFATYSISVSNAGPDLARGVQVVDILDPNMVYVGGSLPCTEEPPGMLVCAIGDMAPATTVSFDVVVQVDASAPVGSSVAGSSCPGGEDVCNRASVSSPAVDPDPSDNQAEVATNVVATTGVAALSLVKSDIAAEPVTPGSSFVYRIEVANQGPAAATNVVVHETIGSSLLYVNDSAGCAVTTVAGTSRTTLSCSLGDLASGATVELFVQVQVDPGARVDSTLQDGDCTGLEDVCNSAFVTSDAADAVISDNADSEPTDVSELATCNNGSLDAGEQCDTPSAEVCNNGVDDDADLIVDCSDPDCGGSFQSCDGNCQLAPPCVPILNDPAKLNWNVVSVHGRFIASTLADPLLEGFRFVISNAEGVVYSAELLPGDMRVRVGAKLSRWIYKDREAKRGRGLRDGIYRVGIHERFEQTGEISYVFRFQGYGDMSRATLSRMSTHAYIGDDVAFLEATWSGEPGAWFLTLKDASAH